jgi:hypothetical protein
MAGIPDSKIKSLAKADMDMILRNADRKSTFDLIKSMNKSQLDSLMKKSGIKKGVSGYKSIAGGLKTGGRVGLKSGSKGCKLAMKGKGRAYGKNS